MKIIREYFNPNKYARSEKKLRAIEKIVIHYIGNAGSTALNNIRYYSEMGTNPNPRYGGFHAVIDFDGTVYESMPRDEVAYGCGTKYYRNYTDLGKRLYDTYGSPNHATFNIEFCHPDHSGKPTNETRDSLIDYVGSLLNEFNLTVVDVVRHSDIVKPAVKKCPLYYVQNMPEWNKLLMAIEYRRVIPMNEETRQETLKAIDRLALKGFINNPEHWKSTNLADKLPAYAVFLLIDRITSDYGMMIDKLDKRR